MKTPPVSVLLALCAILACSACGGAAFTTADADLFEADAGPDAPIIVIGDPRPDAAMEDASLDSSALASDASDDALRNASGDADASDADATPESAPQCTTFSALGGPDPTSCAGIYATPGYYAIVGNAGDGVACWTEMPTPTACQCEETYNCACLAQANGCAQSPGGKTWGSCTQSAGGEVTVTCR